MLTAGIAPSERLTQPAVAARAGLVLAIGGALTHDNAAVWERLVVEAGGAGSRFAVFATAAEKPARTGERLLKVLRHFGAEAELIPVAPKLRGVDWQARRDDPDWVARVASAQAVFFSGGAQEFIVDALRPGGAESAMLQAVRQVFARGGVVAGTSAGAAIMSEWMFRDAQDSLAVLKGRLREGHEIDRGFGFTGPDLFIDQHFLKRGRIARLLPALVNRGCRFGLGIEENSAALIRDGRIELIGARGALLVDLGAARHEPEAGAFQLKGAALSYLDRGDVHDLRTGLSTAAADKRDGRIDASAGRLAPGRQPAGFFPDILGDNTLVNAMVELLESGEPELRGLAFDGRSLQGAPDDAARLGFEFRLYTGPDTVGYASSAHGGEDYSLFRVYLDVRPVRMNATLYGPWASSSLNRMQSIEHPLPGSSPGSARHLLSLRFGPSGGRRALLQASLHADEIPPMLVAQHLRRRLSELEAAGRLQGEVLLLPACNPIGLGQQVWGRLQGRFELGSGQNFNRHYPDLAADAAARFRASGASLGDDAATNARLLRTALHQTLDALTPTSQLQAMRQQLMRLALDAELVLDLHCDNEAVMHLYATPQHEARACLLGRCLRAPLVLMAEESGDAPFDEANSMIWPKLRELLGGKVPLAGFAATVEFRGETEVSHALAAQDAEGLLRFLGAQGFITGMDEAEPFACEPRPLAGCMPVTAPHAGLLVWAGPVGGVVKAGELLADLVDPLSGESTPLRSPVDGLFFARELQRWAQAGQSVAKVAGRVAQRSGKLLSA